MILDTTAVIGLLELRADRDLLLDAIRAAGGTDRPAVSVVTLGELAAGVHAAGDQPERRSARQRTLDAVEAQHLPPTLQMVLTHLINPRLLAEGAAQIQQRNGRSHHLTRFFRNRQAFGKIIIRLVIGLLGIRKHA